MPKHSSKPRLYRRVSSSNCSQHPLSDSSYHRCVRQATGSLLDHLMSPVHLCKFTLKEGYLSDKAFYLLTSRGCHRGTLCHHSRHPLLSVPLYQGGSVLRIIDPCHNAILCCSNLLSRSLYSKYHRNTGGLRSGGGLPCPSHLCPQHRHVRATPGQLLQKQKHGELIEIIGSSRHTCKLSPLSSN
jgi:hypothetical protein